MAFNLGAFVGGFSEKLTERIEEEEDRLQKRLEEERQLAMRQRAARSAERKKKQAAIEEATGLMKVLGFNESNIATALSQGTQATNFYIDAAKANYAKHGFQDPNIMFEAAGDNQSPESVANDIKEVGNKVAKTAQPPVDGITNTTLSGASPTMDGGVSDARNEYFRSAFGSPPEYLSSLDNALAVIVQKQMNASGEELEELERKEKFIRSKMEDEGKEDDRKFDLSTVNSFAKRYRADAIQGIKGVEFDSVSGQVRSIKEGKQGELAIAEASAAGNLQTFNNTFTTPDIGVTAEVNQYLYKAKQDLSIFANNVAQVSSLSDDALTSDTALQSRKQSYGSYYKGNVAEITQDYVQGLQKSDVISYNGQLLVFVGFDSPLAEKTNKGTFPFFDVTQFYNQVN